MRDVYDRNLGNTSNVGVSLVHKLTLEHLNLTNFSKMRVDLAAQVSMYMYACARLSSLLICMYVGYEQHSFCSVAVHWKQ